MKTFWLIVRRDLLLAIRSRGELLHPFVFFILVISLFPLGLSPDRQQLVNIAPGVIWVAILLANLMVLERLFREDAESGWVEQWLLVPYPLPLIVLAKTLAHWLLVGLPFLLLSPVVGVLFNLSWHTQYILMLTVLLATPTLSLIGAIFTALSVQLKHGGLLLALLVLPFYVPILIFAASGVSFAEQNLSASGQLAFLGALLVIALPLAPLVTAAALKVGIE